eukprot:363042-Chlamydomonas_euryale.AAC.1
MRSLSSCSIGSSQHVDVASWGLNRAWTWRSDGTHAPKAGPAGMPAWPMLMAVLEPAMPVSGLERTRDELAACARRPDGARAVVRRGCMPAAGRARVGGEQRCSRERTARPQLARSPAASAFACAAAVVRRRFCPRRPASRLTWRRDGRAPRPGVTTEGGLRALGGESSSREPLATFGERRTVGQRNRDGAARIEERGAMCAGWWAGRGAAGSQRQRELEWCGARGGHARIARADASVGPSTPREAKVWALKAPFSVTVVPTHQDTRRIACPQRPSAMLRVAAELVGHDSGLVGNRDIPEDCNRRGSAGRVAPDRLYCSASHAHAPGACACSCCAPSSPCFQHGLPGVRMEEPSRIVRRWPTASLGSSTSCEVQVWAAKASYIIIAPTPRHLTQLGAVQPPFSSRSNCDAPRSRRVGCEGDGTGRVGVLEDCNQLGCAERTARDTCPVQSCMLAACTLQASSAVHIHAGIQHVHAASGNWHASPILTSRQNACMHAATPNQDVEDTCAILSTSIDIGT